MWRTELRMQSWQHGDRAQINPGVGSGLQYLCFGSKNWNQRFWKCPSGPLSWFWYLACISWLLSFNPLSVLTFQNCSFFCVQTITHPSPDPKGFFVKILHFSVKVRLFFVPADPEHTIVHLWRKRNFRSAFRMTSGPGKWPSSKSGSNCTGQHSCRPFHRFSCKKAWRLKGKRKQNATCARKQFS